MPGLDSDKVEKALLNKMQAVRQEGKDWKYIIYNDKKKQGSRTRLAKGAKHILRPNRVSEWPISWAFRILSNFTTWSIVRLAVKKRLILWSGVSISETLS